MPTPLSQTTSHGRPVTLAVFLLASGFWSLASGAQRPNLVFILADDLGWADTTLYGHTELYETPHLERLAKRGMTFTRAYSASPLCSPTRASILTGLNPARIGLTTPNCHTGPVVLKATPGKKGAPGKKAVQPNPVSRLDTSYETLAERLKAEGYATGHFGKWHLGMPPHSPLEHGFTVDIPHWPGPGPAGSFVAPWKYPDFDPQTPKEHIEDRMAEEAMAWMEQHKDRPFFLNYWMFSVHAPFDAKADLIEEYRGKVDPADPQRSPTYAAMVESMDDAVGTLLDALDRLGIADNTILIFFSDNGGNMYNEVDGTTPTSNDPLRGGKATMFEGGVRVPMVVAWPGHVEPATTSGALVQSTDFYPTVLEMLDLEARPEQVFDGVNILPALRGEDLDRGPIFTYFPHDPPVPDWIPPSVSVHHGDWKLIREFFQGEGGAHRYRLFNLQDDLGETTNLAATKPEKVTELDALITTFLDDTAAVLPVPNPAFDPAKYRPELEGVNRVRQPKPKPAKPKDDPFDPALKGWKARLSTATVKDGFLTVTGTGADPFLGTGATGLTGPATVTLRLRTAKGGLGRVSWANGTPKRDELTFPLSKGERWKEVEIRVPAADQLSILRLHFPPKQTVDIDWIKVTDGTLGGSGSVVGDVTVDPGAGLAYFVTDPGAPLGGLDVAGTLTLPDPLVISIDSGGGIFPETGATGLVVAEAGSISGNPTITLDTSKFTGFGSWSASIVGNQVLLDYTAGADPFASYMATFFPGETDPLIVGPGADPDGDGVSNLKEFAFGGNPDDVSDRGVSASGINDVAGTDYFTLTIAVRDGAVFSGGGTALTASIDGIDYTIDGSAGLQAFDALVSEVTPAIAGSLVAPTDYVLKTFQLNPAASAGIGFIRCTVAETP